MCSKYVIEFFFLEFFNRFFLPSFQVYMENLLSEASDPDWSLWVLETCI